MEKCSLLKTHNSRKYLVLEVWKRAQRMALLQQQQHHPLEVMSGKETMRSKTVSPVGSQYRFKDSRIMGKEEILDLRHQLQMETENIARWKASTEIQAKNMERDLQEKQNIIEDQRSNLMELQLHSEHLSHSLFQERQERALVSDKVEHTRQLFLTFQEHYEQLSETVSSFQNTKDELQKEHDSVIDKLKAFNESFKLQENEGKQMIVQAQEIAHSFKNAKESWKRNIMEKDQELEELNVQLEKLKSEIQNLSESLESTTSNLSSVQNEKTQLVSELDEMRLSLGKAEEQLKLQNESVTEQMTRVDEELKLKHEQLVERTKEFQEAAEKIQYLKKANDTLEGAKSELTERVTALAARKQELEEEISCKENLIQTLQSDHERSSIEINELNERVSDVSSQLSTVTNHKEALEQERNMLAEKLQNTKKKLLKKKNLLEQFKEQVITLETDLEAKKAALTHLEKENKDKEEIYHSLEVSFNEVNKHNIKCNEAVQEMAEQISLAENHETQLREEKKKLEEDVEKVSSELKAKVQECEDLSATIKELKEEIKTIEEQCEVKIKNVSSETKSRRILEQKIHGLEETVKKATKKAENQETELKKIKNVVAEKEKELEELKVSLDHSLCEKQEIQYRYEAKDQSFQNYQNYTTSNLETLKAELELTKEMLEKAKAEHEQQVLKLQEELEKTKETLKSSKAAHENELQKVEKSLLDQSTHNVSVTQYKEEVTSLGKKIETLTKELEQAKEESNTAIKEKLHIKLESDNKVKEMSDLLDIYKTNKETKFKVLEEEHQKSQSQIKQLVQEKDELLAKIKAQTKSCNEDGKVKVAITQAVKKEVEKISIPPLVSPSVKTPSPRSYLDTMNMFPKPTTIGNVKKPEANKVQGKPVTGILKPCRRTLLPPGSDVKKRVLFKHLPSMKGYASGDSSSDAFAFETPDSDEPFEEIKRPRRYPGSRPESVPRANVAPFIPETNTPQKPASSLNEGNMDNEVKKEPPTNSSRRKRTRSDLQKQNLKTYSAVSPKNKHQKIP